MQLDEDKRYIEYVLAALPPVFFKEVLSSEDELEMEKFVADSEARYQVIMANVNAALRRGDDPVEMYMSFRRACGFPVPAEYVTGAAVNGSTSGPASSSSTPSASPTGITQ